MVYVVLGGCVSCGVVVGGLGCCLVVGLVVFVFVVCYGCWVCVVVVI